MPPFTGAATVTVGASPGMPYEISQHEPVPPLLPLTGRAPGSSKVKEPIWLLADTGGVFTEHGCSGSGPTYLTSPTSGFPPLYVRVLLGGVPTKPRRVFSVIWKWKSLPSVARKLGLVSEPHVPFVPGYPGHVSSYP